MTHFFQQMSSEISVEDFYFFFQTLVVISIAVLASFFLKIFLKSKLLLESYELSGSWGSLFLHLVEKTKLIPVIVFVGYTFMLFAQPTEDIPISLKYLLYFAFVYQAVVWSLATVKFYQNRLDRKFQEKHISSVGILFIFIRIAVIAIIVLFAMNQIGVDIKSLLAGLGIGGIAVALAAQNILSDIFASLSIIFDRVFTVGDVIIFGVKIGTVEHIGIRSTRIRSITGELIVYSNKKLLDEMIHNYKTLTRRRITHNFGVEYGTNHLSLQSIPIWVKAIVEEVPQADFGWCNFIRYADSSLLFEFVFWVNAPEYIKYLEVQQSILFKMNEKFYNEGVKFAFPSRTIYMEKEKDYSAELETKNRK